MKISKADRERAKAKFEKAVAENEASMAPFNTEGNDRYEPSEVKRVRAIANAEFSVLAKKSINLQSKAYESLANFYIR